MERDVRTGRVGRVVYGRIRPSPPRDMAIAEHGLIGDLQTVAFVGTAGTAAWSEVRDRMYSQMIERGWHPGRRAFVRHYDADVLDASLLLMPRCKFIASTDPRWASALDAMTAELLSDSLVYRHNVDASPDGLAGMEATLSMCSFWWVQALTRAGRLDEARLAFEKMLTYGNHVGLYSEEIGPTSEQLGNFRQAFRHLASITPTYNLDRALG